MCGRCRKALDGPNVSTGSLEIGSEIPSPKPSFCQPGKTRFPRPSGEGNMDRQDRQDEKRKKCHAGLIRSTLRVCAAMNRCDWRKVGGLRRRANNSGSIMRVGTFGLQPDRARSSIGGACRRLCDDTPGQRLRSTVTPRRGHRRVDTRVGYPRAALRAAGRYEMCAAFRGCRSQSLAPRPGYSMPGLRPEELLAKPQSVRRKNFVDYAGRPLTGRVNIRDILLGIPPSAPPSSSCQSCLSMFPFPRSACGEQDVLSVSQCAIEAWSVCSPGSIAPAPQQERGADSCRCPFGWSGL